MIYYDYCYIYEYCEDCPNFDKCCGNSHYGDDEYYSGNYSDLEHCCFEDD